MNNFKKLFAFLLVFTIVLQSSNDFMILANDYMHSIVNSNVYSDDSNDPFDQNNEEYSETEIEEDTPSEDINNNDNNEDPAIEEQEEPGEEIVVNEDEASDSTGIVEAEIENSIITSRYIREYELETDGISGDAISLLNMGNYNNLSSKDKDTLLMELSVREDTMSVLANNNYGIKESVPIARIMQQLDISLEEALLMIQNHNSVGNAAFEANELRSLSITNPTLFYDYDAFKELTLLIINGFTSEEAINAYVMSLVLNMELSEIAVINNDFGIDDIIIPADKQLLENENLVIGENEVVEEDSSNQHEDDQELDDENNFSDQADNNKDSDEQQEIQEDTDSEIPLPLNEYLTFSSNNKNLLKVDDISDNKSETGGADDKDLEESEVDESEKDTDKDLPEIDEEISENLNGNSQGTEDEPLEEDDILKETLTETDEKEKIEFKIAEEDIKSILEIAKAYSINPNILIEFMIKYETNIEGIKDYVDKVEQLCEFKREQQSPMQRASYEPTQNVSWQYPSAAPFSYKSNSNEIININTGSLIYTDNIVNLKGKNGLDLDVSFVYDSSEATQDQTYGEIDSIRLFDGNASSDFGTSEEAYPFTINYHGNLRYKAITDIAAGWSLNTTKIFWDPEHFYDNYNRNQSGYSEMYLKLSNGSSYLLEQDSKGYKLKDYKLNDIKLEPDIYATYPNSSYVLTYANGIKEYIGSSTVAKRDRFNNVILYSYSGRADYGTITITDTMGRIVVIKLDDYTITVTLPNNEKIHYSRQTVAPDDIFYTQLTSKTDQLGRRTSFTYQMRNGKFDYFHQTEKQQHIFTRGETETIWEDGGHENPLLYTIYRLGGFRFANLPNFHIHVDDYQRAIEKSLVGPRYSSYSYSNVYHTLTKVSYPTGAYTAYTYQRAKRRLGPFGNADYFAVTNRYDYDMGSKYNDTNYTYGINGNSDNNYCYYDLGELDGSEKLDDYRYYVTEKQGNRTITYMFNHKHQLLEKTTKGDSSQFITKNTYTNTGLVASIENTIKQNNQSHTTKELFEYDNYGNVTACWLPLAEGNKSNTEYKTTYTYDSTYQIMTSRTYKQSNTNTIKENFILDGNKRYVARQEVLLNGVLKNKTEYMANSSGMITNKKAYIDSTKYIEEKYTYENGIYLASSEINSVKERYEYDLMGNMRRLIDRNGNITTFEYDSAGRLLKTTKPDQSILTSLYNDRENTIITTDELGSKFKFTYNGLGLVVEKHDMTSGKIIGKVIYDTNMNIISDTDANGVTTAYKYDVFNRIIESNKAGYRENYEYLSAYDSKGSKTLKTIKGSSNAPDIKTAVYTDKYGRKLYESGFANGILELITSYEYDYLGNVLSFLNPDDREKGLKYTMQYQYDYYSEPIKSTDALGNNTTAEYDFLERKISATDAKNNVFRYKYDIFGNLAEEELPFEGIHKSFKRYTYDLNGNLLTSSITVNKPGEPSEETETKNKYNNLNQLIRIETGNSYTEYTYDKKGNKTQVKTANGSQILSYEYDYLSRITKYKDAMGKEECYTYDAMGNLLTKQDRNGNITTNRYDSLNNLTEVRITGSNGQLNEYLKYSYYPNNLLMKEENENSTSEYKYDALGRVMTITENNGVKKEYFYDSGGKRSYFNLYVNGTVKLYMIYTYDTLNRLIEVKKGNRLEAIYGYDENGNRSHMILGNGVKTEYTYNDANLLTSLKNTQGKLVSSYDYTYFLDGNQESKTDHNGLKTTYAYDDHRRLISENQFSPNENTIWEYEYDIASNRSAMRIIKDDATELTSYVYDKNNRLLSEFTLNSKTGEQKTSSYTYDANGNQLMKTMGSVNFKDADLTQEVRISLLGTENTENHGYERFSEEFKGILKAVETSAEESLNISVLLSNSTDSNTSAENIYTEISTYDGFNRLQTVRMKGITAEYRYRSDGLRIQKTVNGQTTIHVWDGSNMIAELDSRLQVKDLYIRGITLIKSEAHGYYIYNGHGDVVQLSDLIGGGIVKEYTYDAFGVEKDIDDTDLNLFRYCGEYFDRETGRIYLRARYYVPSLGRFMSEDPIRAGLNWYTYCENNPIMFVDPFGLEKNTLNRFLADMRDLYGYKNVSIIYPEYGKGNVVTVEIKQGDGTILTGKFDRDKMYRNTEGDHLLEREDFMKGMGINYNKTGGNENNIFTVSQGEEFVKKAGLNLFYAYAGYIIPVDVAKGLKGIKNLKGFVGPAIITTLDTTTEFLFSRSNDDEAYLPAGTYYTETYYFSNYNKESNLYDPLITTIYYKQEYTRNGDTTWILYKITNRKFDTSTAGYYQ